jgi:ABC-type transport system involved in multi-copper enzyme maturation permease subunit
MFKRGFDMVSVEVFQMRHRVSTWVLLAIWGSAALFFNYVLPYLTDEVETPSGERLGGFARLLPEQLVETMVAGFPFYGGAIALMLGVLTVGSEFAWGTWKTLFTLRPGRAQVFAAKMGALGIVLVPFVILVFAIGAGASAFVAWREDAAIVWPSVQRTVEAMMAGWLILAVWAMAGVLLAIATRGTSLAIGVGLLYSLVIEGVVGNFASRISWLEPVIELSLRANAYSLVRPLGGIAESAGEGPGAFSGPYLGSTQALAMLVGYVIVFLGLSVWLIRRRDVV